MHICPLSPFSALLFQVFVFLLGARDGGPGGFGDPGDGGAGGVEEHGPALLSCQKRRVDAAARAQALLGSRRRGAALPSN